MRWAKDVTIQYQYRKIFKLSYEEYMKEPIDVFYANLRIMDIISQLEKRESKRAKRASKRLS